MKNLTPAERAELEAVGAAIADRVEAGGPSPDSVVGIDSLPPAIALQHAALRRAIALPLGLTAEGARRRYAHQNHDTAAPGGRRATSTTACTTPSGHAT